MFNLLQLFLKFRFTRPSVQNFALVLFLFMTIAVSAQDLEHLPPCINPKVNKDSGVTLIFASGDFQTFSAPKDYVSAIQMIDVDNSWPPRWYTATVHYTEEMFDEDKKRGRIAFNLYGVPEVINNYLFFGTVLPVESVDSTKALESQLAPMYRVLDTHLEQVDNIRSNHIYGGDYTPDYRKNPKIELSVKTESDSIWDLSGISGNKADKAVEMNYNAIRVIDNEGKEKFVWIPLYSYDPKVFDLKTQLEIRSKDPDPRNFILRSGRLCLGSWDHDGDILYALANNGIGKISTKTGRLDWHTEIDKMPLIEGKDTFECYNPWDPKYIGENDTAWFYCFYEQKDDTSPYSRGVVFEQNKKTNHLKSIKYINSKWRYVAGDKNLERGGFDYDMKTGNYILDFGVYHNGDSEKYTFQSDFQYGRNDSVYAVFQLPKWNYCVGVHRLEKWPLPPRPVIQQKGGYLEVVGNLKSWTWYKLTGTNNTVVKEVGKGPKITAEKGTTYCVAGPYGVGYCVSHAYTVKP